MNCANHPDRERAAFCQNCGKPLCTECARTVGTSIFCEPCLAARVVGAAAPGYGYAPGPTSGPIPGTIPGTVPPVAAEPNPGLAALLGFIPGVGAMYNEQYAKGIVHLIVFAILISLTNDVNGIFGLFVAGWVCYMVIEAHHTARARRDGTPLPNPFGLNDLSERLGFGKAWPQPPTPPAPPYTPPPAGSYGDPAAPPSPGYSSVYGSAPVSSFVDSTPGFNPAAGAVPPTTPPYTSPYSSGYVPPAASWGAPQDSAYNYVPPIPPVPPVPPMPPYVDPNLPYQRRVPAGAIWLIGLGVLFLFGNSGLFTIHLRYFGPFLLIGIGVWIFVRKMTSTGLGLENDGTPHYQYRLVDALRGSVWLFVTGFVWLLDAFHILSWGRSWPIFLIAGGILLFIRRTAEFPGANYPPTGYAPYSGAPPYTPPSAPPVTSTEIVPTQASTDITHDQEGR
jgi:hypothetical protein